ncbi:MAG TPA: hypothetical protein VGP03_06050 [Pseudonocardiaceae bacterium]|jgi:hypothetical protein|nr:hypothetical protein [Pseudonocardiaceae bacterium]
MTRTAERTAVVPVALEHLCPVGLLVFPKSPGTRGAPLTSAG